MGKNLGENARVVKSTHINKMEGVDLFLRPLRFGAAAAGSCARKGGRALKSLRLPQAPKDLSAEARAIWRQLTRDYQIDDRAGLVLLRTTLEAFDSMRQAQEQIEQDGATYRDRFGQTKAHPLLPVVRDSRAQFMAGLKALNLDLEPASHRIGRPAGK